MPKRKEESDEAASHDTRCPDINYQQYRRLSVMLSVSERGNGGRNDSTDRLNTSMLLPALLSVETSHITARRLRKPQLEGWHGPRRKTGKALLFLPQHRVLVGGKGGF